MKPVVTYTGAIVPPQVNGVAIIVGIEGHPRQGSAGFRGGDIPTRTSRVVRVGENGEFEAENTIYRLEAA